MENDDANAINPSPEVVLSYHWDDGGSSHSFQVDVIGRTVTLDLSTNDGNDVKTIIVSRACAPACATVMLKKLDKHTRKHCVRLTRLAIKAHEEAPR